MEDFERNEDDPNARDQDGSHHQGTEKHDKKRDEFAIEVIYNGVKKGFEVRHRDLVKSLLDKAVAAFGSPPNPHTLSLFNSAGAELKDEQTLAAAGVKPRDTLLLRPSTVKGG